MARKNHLQTIVIWGNARPVFSHRTLLRLLCEEYISHDNATVLVYHAVMGDAYFVRGTHDKFDELSHLDNGKIN